MSNYEALKAHIEAINDRTREWLKEDSRRWAGIVVSDPEHWAEYGIYTPEQYDRYMVLQSNYEVCKDVNGYRRSNDFYEGMTNDEIDADTYRMVEYDNQTWEDSMGRLRLKILADELGVSTDDLKRWGCF